MSNELWANPPTAKSVARHNKGLKLIPVAGLLILVNVVLFASCSSPSEKMCFNCDSAVGLTSPGA